MVDAYHKCGYRFRLERRWNGQEFIPYALDPVSILTGPFGPVQPRIRSPGART